MIARRLAVLSIVAAGCGQVQAGSDSKPRCGSPTLDHQSIAHETQRPRPEFGLWHTDPALGGCLARVSDHGASDGAPSAQTTAGRRAFNADDSRVLLASGVVLDATSFEPVAVVEHTPAIWAAEGSTDVFYAKANSLYRQDLQSGASELVASFVEYRELDTRAGLRDVSADGRFVALVGVRAVDGVHEIFVWDFAQSARSALVHGPVDAVGRATGPRWVRVAPSGRSVVVGWPEAGTGPYQGIQSFDIDMRPRARLSAGNGAADLVVERSGAEALVEYSPADHGPALRKTPLSVGGAESRELLVLDWFDNVRLACSSSSCAISTQGDPSSVWHPFENEVFVLDVDSAAVERLAHHHSAPEFVAAQSETHCPLSPEAVLPNPAPSRDGSSVLFTSNWNAHCFGELYLLRR